MFGRKKTEQESLADLHRRQVEAEKNRAKVAPMVRKETGQLLQKGGGAVGGTLRGIASVAGAVKTALPRGIRHPDTLVQRPELYVGGSGGFNKSLFPTGRRMTNWRDMYPGSHGGSPHPLGMRKSIPPVKRIRLF